MAYSTIQLRISYGLLATSCRYRIESNRQRTGWLQNNFNKESRHHCLTFQNKLSPPSGKSAVKLDSACPTPISRTTDSIHVTTAHRVEQIENVLQLFLTYLKRMMTNLLKIPTYLGSIHHMWQQERNFLPTWRARCVHSGLGIYGVSRDSHVLLLLIPNESSWTGFDIDCKAQIKSCKSHAGEWPSIRTGGGCLAEPNSQSYWYDLKYYLGTPSTYYFDSRSFRDWGSLSCAFDAWV